MRVLIAEDDADAARVIDRFLKRDGHSVDVVATGDEALWLAGEVRYDAILLDVNLPPPTGSRCAAASVPTTCGRP